MLFFVSSRKENLPKEAKLISILFLMSGQFDYKRGPSGGTSRFHGLREYGQTGRSLHSEE